MTEYARSELATALKEKPREGLRQEEHGLGVGRHAMVEARLAAIQDIGARQRTDTGIVDECGERPERILSAAEDVRVSAEISDVPRQGDGLHPFRLYLRNRPIERGGVRMGIGGDGEAAPCERQRDSPSDSAACSGDEGVLPHPVSSRFGTYGHFLVKRLIYTFCAVWPLVKGTFRLAGWSLPVGA